jgi:murein DD-endopeptidase MepM/ murein hydrolase activator NlpD
VDVNAPFPARVLRLNWDLDRLGRSIEVRYLDSGVIAWFCHLDAVSDRVKEGAMLGSGDVIAVTGNTGKTSRAGLLYRTFRSKDEGEPEPISPLDIHEKVRAELPAADRVNFVAIRAKVEQLFALVDAAPPSP